MLKHIKQLDGHYLILSENVFTLEIACLGGTCQEGSIMFASSTVFHTLVKLFNSIKIFMTGEQS